MSEIMKHSNDLDVSLEATTDLLLLFVLAAAICVLSFFDFSTYN